MKLKFRKQVCQTNAVESLAACFGTGINKVFVKLLASAPKQSGMLNITMIYVATNAIGTGARG
jgi:hypothetical protein